MIPVQHWNGKQKSPNPSETFGTEMRNKDTKCLLTCSTESLVCSQVVQPISRLPKLASSWASILSILLSMIKTSRQLWTRCCMGWGMDARCSRSQLHLSRGTWSAESRHDKKTAAMRISYQKKLDNWHKLASYWIMEAGATLYPPGTKDAKGYENYGR